MKYNPLYLIEQEGKWRFVDFMSRAEFQKRHVLERARLMVKDRDICDNCLGRQFAQVSTGMTNKERGEIIRKNLNLREPGKCSVCNNIFKRLDEISRDAERKLSKIEYRTFAVGTRMSRDIVEREESLWEETGIEYCEPIRSELNRELGKLIEKSTRKEVDEKNPNVLIILDLAKQGLDITINPLFVKGRYKKLVRGIPQTKWDKYKTTVEDIIAKPFMKQSRAKGHSLHACVNLNTNIILENYCVVPIKHLRNSSEKIITFDIKEKKLHKSNVLDYFELEPQKINLNTFKVMTKETNREIVATEDHEFYTPNGMAAIRKLKPNDIVAVLPHRQSVEKLVNQKTILDKDCIIEVVNKYYPKYKFADKVTEELKNKGFIPLKTNDPRFLILTRILAFLFGDGNVRCIKNKDISLEFYGREEDLNEIKMDLDLLGFKHSTIRKHKSFSIVKNYYDEERTISGEGKRFVTYSRALWFLMVALGAPIGDKIVNKLEIPKWIENADMIIKREFLASILGCEIDKPRLDKRKYNKKSFYTPRFSMNKIEKNLDNGIEFMNKISDMLKEFDVDTLKLRLVPHTKRKDGYKTIKIMLDINNRFENILNLYGNVGFRYCKEKERLARLVFEYLSMKKIIVDKRKLLYKKALELKKKGFQLSEIHKKLGSQCVTKNNLWVWLHKAKEQNIKVPNNFPNFDDWLKHSTKGLEDGLVWETIESISKANINKVCDITTNPTHTFFANGFLVSNCGREDIDAKCLDWRPFVLELSEPKKRFLDLKKLEREVNKSKKVMVMGLKLSDKKDVVRIKELRPDKTYRLLVSFSKPPGDLEKLKTIIGEVKQRTPERVLHRRPDLLRKRKVKSIKWKKINNKSLEIEIKAEAGLYVKELVTGDNGRTRPSISELLGNPGRVKELDVIKIHLK